MTEFDHFRKHLLLTLIYAVEAVELVKHWDNFNSQTVSIT